MFDNNCMIAHRYGHLSCMGTVGYLYECCEREIRKYADTCGHGSAGEREIRKNMIPIMTREQALTHCRVTIPAIPTMLDAKTFRRMFHPNHDSRFINGLATSAWMREQLGSSSIWQEDGLPFRALGDNVFYVRMKRNAWCNEPGELVIATRDDEGNLYATPFDTNPKFERDQADKVLGDVERDLRLFFQNIEIDKHFLGRNAAEKRVTYLFKIEAETSGIGGLPALLDRILSCRESENVHFRVDYKFRLENGDLVRGYKWF